MWVKGTKTKMKKEKAFDEVAVRECERENGDMILNESIYLAMCVSVSERLGIFRFLFFFVFEETRQSKVLMEEVTLGFM